MIIALGCDHIVTPIKNEVKKYLESKNITVIDCGTYDEVRTHYPVYGRAVGKLVATKKADLGIVICGTGVGISNSANKTKNIRAILTRNVSTAIDARKNWDANVLGMGGRITGFGLMCEIIDAFIETKYENKNVELIQKINNLIKHDNFEDSLLDKEIQDWHDGYYCDGERQEQICLPNIANDK